MLKETASVLIIAMFVFGGAVVEIPALALVVSTTISTTEQFAPFMGTLARPHSTVGTGIDLPAITYAYGQTKTSYADDFNNLTATPLTVGGVALTISTFQNSTTADYRFSALVGVNLVSGDMFWTSQGFNNLMIIKGTISGLVGSLPLVLQFSGGALSFSNGGTKISQGHLSFDWSADPGLAVWNNATKQLTFTLSSNFNIDPLALDNTAAAGCAAALSCTTGSSTFAINDIVIVFCSAQSGTDTFTSVTNSGTAITWTKRKSVSQTGLELDEFYGIPASTRSFTITCNSSLSLAINIKAAGFAGADTTTIFDQNAAVPCSATGISATESCTLSTNNASDLIFGGFTNIAGVGITLGSGFSLAGNTAIPQVEYKIVSVAQTNLAVSATTAVSQTWNMIGDAIMGLTLASTTTATTTTTTTVNNNLSDPPNFDWFLLAPIGLLAVVMLMGRKKLRF